MKIAFSLTGPDLARALTAIARDAARPAQAARKPDKTGTISPEARRLLTQTTEADNGGDT